MAGADLYGLAFAEGLPGFAGTAAAGASDSQSAFFGLLCAASLERFRASSSFSPDLLPAVETTLRSIAAAATPTPADAALRLALMDRLKRLARSGIQFCQGLDVEPYGSFVSGLYTPLGDLDVSIEGVATWVDDAGFQRRVAVADMERPMKQRFLNALANRVSRWAAGRVERITHARVPIIKFVDAHTRLECDVGIDGGGALFKSAVLGLLSQYDWRFGALCRLVKLWARGAGINDASAGTLNSFCITLMVVFHLQTRAVPVLPPIGELFAGVARPMQGGALPDPALLRVGGLHLQAASRASCGAVNSETLTELLASFFALYGGALGEGWLGQDEALSRVLRRVRVDTWSGCLRHEAWEKDGYLMCVEDPFDSTDNCARTVRSPENAARIATAFSDAAEAMQELTRPEDAFQRLEWLFGAHAAARGDAWGLLHARSPPVVKWIRPVDLILPPRIQGHAAGALPAAVAVDHCRPRIPAVDAEAVTGQLLHMRLAVGGPAKEPGAAPELAAAGRATAAAPLVADLEDGGDGEDASPTAPPPPGLSRVAAVGITLPLPPGIAVGSTASMAQLRALLQPQVTLEARLLLELRQAQAAAAEAAAEIKNAARAAKRAAKKAERPARRRSSSRSRNASPAAGRSEQPDQAPRVVVVERVQAEQSVRGPHGGLSQAGGERQASRRRPTSRGRNGSRSSSSSAPQPV